MAFLAGRMIWEFGYRRSKMEKIYRRIRTVYTIANTAPLSPSVASSVYAVNTAVFSPNNTYGSTTSNQKYVLYHTAVQ